jgi:hypothetical protein
MFPLIVDPKWYENYWLTERAKPRGRVAGRIRGAITLQSGIVSFIAAATVYILDRL